jgi:protein-S-isoprenylcysteine O-methyltransferase Ste14
MEKLNPLGSGPVIGGVTLPYLAITIVLTILYPEIFNLHFLSHTVFLIVGLIFTFIGVIFYAASARTLLKGLKNNELLTNGPFAWSQNPLYVSFIVFIIPGVSLMAQSWLMLTACIVGYLLFKVSIHKEYEQCERIFGDKYTAYRKRTSELIPFPPKRAVK